MPKISVTIEYDYPGDPFWLNPDNVSLCLHAQCVNTKFHVTRAEVQQPHPWEQSESRVLVNASHLGAEGGGDMGQYRKKPVIVNAQQFKPDKNQWPDGVISWNETDSRPRDMSWGYIQTLEGPLHVQADDWIITGIQGEKYPCKPDIFLTTYEAVEEVAQAWRERKE